MTLTRQHLLFERPTTLDATQPPETRGLARDEVRLLVTTPGGNQHSRFYHLPEFLTPGDLLVVNRSATLPASLPARAEINGRPTRFILNLSTHYSRNLWLAEPRWRADKPGPLPLQPGGAICAAGVNGRLVAPFPQISRLWFIQFERDLLPAARQHGRPIRYGYLHGRYPLHHYQTLFADRDREGSAEMPSAARPFTQRVIAALKKRGIDIAPITLHTGVSSLEVEVDNLADHPLYAEPFEIPAATAAAVNSAKRHGRRVVAVGTTVIRALESAVRDDGALAPARGFTRRYIHPGHPTRLIDGLLTGMHDAATSHLALLYAIAGEATIRAAYAEAVERGYLWHEFGDSHLILT